MKWNAFNLITPAIDKTKSLLFPIDIKYWIKLTFVTMLSAYGRSGGGSSFSNLNSSFDGLSSVGTNKETSLITGNSISKFMNKNIINPTITTIIALSTFFVVMLMIIFNYITSRFTFIHIKALTKKRFSIKKEWKKHSSKGFSLFLFRILIGVISLIVTACILIYPLFKIFSSGFISYINNSTILTVIIDFLPFLIILVIWSIIFYIFKKFVFDFSIVLTYHKNNSIKESIKKTFKKLNKQKLEGLVYLIAWIFLGIASTIISIMIFIILLIIAIIIAFTIGSILYFFISIISNTFAVILLAILGIIYLLATIFVFMIILLPIITFLKYFSLLSYEKFFNTKLL